jgi:hypothetical protein
VRRIMVLLLRAPVELVSDLIFYAISWFERLRNIIKADENLLADGFKLWDRLAGQVYGDARLAALGNESNVDIISAALSEPGGVLANFLVQLLSGRDLAQDAGVPDDIKPRLTVAAQSAGRSGLLARVIMAQRLAYLDHIDHRWTKDNLVGFFNWAKDGAQLLWRSRAFDNHPGLPRLFNLLKAPMLEAFQRADFSHGGAQGLIGLLLAALINKKPGEGDTYSIEGMEIRRALAATSADTRKTTAWLLTNWLKEREEGHEGDGTADNRWGERYGAIFKAIWPLEATLRDPETSQQLIWMAQECDTCFPNAVDAVVGSIVPMRLYEVAIEFQLDAKSSLLAKYPLHFVKLLDAAIDPSVYPVPHDLGSVLAELVKAKSDVVDIEAYRRLSGAWRLRQA